MMQIINNGMAAENGRKRSIVNRRTKLLLLVLLIIAVLLSVYLAGAMISDEVIVADFTQKGLKPSWKHPFGTDMLGRDMLIRTIKGLSVSITVGTVASSVSAVIALIVGVIAATGTSWMDNFINWLIDLVMGIPHMLLLILICVACGRGLKGVILGVALTHWTSLARLIRGEVLQLKEQIYIKTARKLGKSNLYIAMKHMAPHLLPQFIVGLVLLFPHAILHESGITFLGFGLSNEQPAIGIILSEAMKYLITGKWWLALFPGIMLVITVVCFYTTGENLRRLLDPASAHE